MASEVRGRPLQVVVSKDDNCFVVDENALTTLLMDSRVRNSKVMILSVAGAYRRGKSFLLNFFLKYLSSNDKSGDWMGKADEPLQGFNWKGGSERATSGILLWSEPFFLDLPSKEKICILLMDTQGAFDSQSTVRECATVFAFSTMISSVQIYNITGNIQEDDLQHLELFIEYGRLALEAYNDKPFQSLHFLVRDWQYPYQHAYGADGGMDFLDRRLEIQERQPFELQNLRRNLRQCFNDIKCFLMPHPGLNVATSATFNGSLSDIEADFKNIVKLFTESIFSPENAVVKTINGDEITGKELVEYFKSYIKVFQGHNLPEPRTMMEATAEANNLAAISNAKDLYTREMEKVCGGGKPYLNERTLDLSNDKWFFEALNQFRSTRKMGGDDFCSTFEVKLEKELQEMYERLKKNNKAKNVMSTAQTPIFFILLSLLAYILSGLFSLAGVQFLMTALNLIMFASILCLLLWCYSRYTGQYRWLGEAMDTVTITFYEFSMQRVPPEMNAAGRIAFTSLERKNK